MYSPSYLAAGDVPIPLPDKAARRLLIVCLHGLIHFQLFFLRFLFCLFLKNSNTFQKLFSLPQLGCSKSYFQLQKSINEPQTHYTVITTDINIHHIAIHIHGI